MLAKATILDPRWRTLAFGNQTNAGEAAARAKCEDLNMSSTSQVIPSILFHPYIGCINKTCFFSIFNSPQQRRPVREQRKRLDVSSGLPSRLVALVRTKKKILNSDQTLYFTVLISCRCYSTVDSTMAEAAVEVQRNLSELDISRGEAPLQLWQHMAAVLIPAHASSLCAVWKSLLKSWSARRGTGWSPTALKWFYL